MPMENQIIYTLFRFFFKFKLNNEIDYQKSNEN